jgi:hypothetical protein
MKNLKVKIVTGFRDDQCYSIDAEEAHKAYRLFNNPDERAIFSDGLAIIGADIRKIEPDYIGTMGWNKGYVLTPDDYAEVSSKGIDCQIREVMEIAKEIAIQRPDLVKLPLSEAIKESRLYLEDGTSKK